MLIKKLLVWLTMFLYAQISVGVEMQHRQFSVLETTRTETINGQIDWPGGKLERWTGPVLVFISAGAPNDRNGWQLLARETIWADRSPLKELSMALVTEGVAVVRFDNPGVRVPELKCRESIFKHGVTEEIVRRQCLDSRILADFTVEKYQRSIEAMLFYIEDVIPATHGKLVLFGFSEGLMHAASIAERRRIKLGGLVSIGSPAERFESLTHWQTIGRMLELLPSFDANADGVVSNDEVRKGYRKGKGNVMGLDGWLSPHGYWDRQNEGEFKLRLDQAYDAFRRDTDTGVGPGKLEWIRQANGVLVPNINDALWNMHFYGQISPAEVMQELRLPGLFLWGEGDSQISVPRQVALVHKAIKDGADIRYFRFPSRHHLLSKRKDMDWLETQFMPVIARTVLDFLNQASCPRPTTE